MTRTVDRFPGVEWVDDATPFIRVDPDKCTGCASCVKVCLGDCWEIKDRKARIKTLEACMECACCWYICDAEAIIFSWPQGGSGYRSDWG